MQSLQTGPAPLVLLQPLPDIAYVLFYVQMLWAPPTTALFFFTMGAAERGDPAAGVQRAAGCTWPTLKANWMLWPAVQVRIYDRAAISGHGGTGKDRGLSAVSD